MQLSISKDYPFSPCQLVVLNPDIPRGLAINLEKGHSTLVKNSKTHLTLVRQMNWIDRNMEVLLRQTPSCKVFSENLLVNDAQLTNIQLLSPSLENVSLFRCGTLHLVVKCMDCKDILDVELESEQDNQVMKKKPCLTCSNNMSVSFFPGIVHQGMKSVGLLRLKGCTAYDILHSLYSGTCKQCMSDLTSTIRLSPYDMPYTENCFSCGTRMTFRLGDYQFIKIKSKEDLMVGELQGMTLKEDGAKQIMSHSL